MAGNPLFELNQAGQSVWLDFLSRDIIRSGELKRLLQEDGVCGVTSNPTIFQGCDRGKRHLRHADKGPGGARGHGAEKHIRGAHYGGYP